MASGSAFTSQKWSLSSLEEQLELTQPSAEEARFICSLSFPTKKMNFRWRGCWIRIASSVTKWSWEFNTAGSDRKGILPLSLTFLWFNRQESICTESYRLKPLDSTCRLLTNCPESWSSTTNPSTSWAWRSLSSRRLRSCTSTKICSTKG